MTKLIPKVIYEDSDILVINKPAGLVVNRAETVKSGWTVMDWIVDESVIKFAGPVIGSSQKVLPGRPVLSGTPPAAGTRLVISEFEMRQGIIHRLDKDTSGVMVVGKTKEAFENIQKQFKERVVKKEYVALVHGLPSMMREGKFVVDAPVGRNPRNRIKWAVVEGGREAVTEFEVIETVGVVTSLDNSLALLRCTPKSGRTHQIRVHLTAVNCPVVCDKLYLGRKQYREDIKWCPRIFLHAEKLGFVHPKGEKEVVFEARLPEDLREVLGKKFQMTKFK